MSALPESWRGVLVDRMLKMKYSRYIVIVLFLFTGIVSAQRDTKEVFTAGEINGIRIDTDEVYLITINSKETSEISIATHSEGEYYNDILLKSEIRNGQLLLSTEYPEILAGGYDKLSAHKVFSLEIELEIPENMEVIINSNIASLVAKGKYKSIYAGLEQGYCQLLNFSGSAVINTFKGDILVETSGGIIDAESRHGKVSKPENLTGRQPIRLTTIDGDIMVRKTK